MRLIRPTITHSPDAEDRPYDLMICAVGYERRSRSAAERILPLIARGVAPAFDTQRVLSFEENKAWFASSGFEIPTVTDAHFHEWATDLVHSALPENSDVLRLAVDVSSFSRFRIASLVDVLRRHVLETPIVVDFLYTLAEYTPPVEDDSPNVHVGPVLDSFAGWSRDPDDRVSAIVGLGYETDRAVGAVEHVQASDVWVFAPVSPIAEYQTPLEAANRSLLEITVDRHLIRYPVLDPLYTLSLVEGLVASSLLSGSAVVFPFGPKIFALVSLLSAAVHPDLAVWRVSPGAHARPSERAPSAYSCAIRATWDPKTAIDWEAEAATMASWY